MSQKFQFVLEALSGPIAGNSFKFNKQLILGRSSGDVLLQDTTTSNPHAEIIVYESGSVMLIDKDSKNGVFVNGTLKTKTILDSGSKFTIGSIEFEIKKIQAPEKIWNSVLSKALMQIKNNQKKLQCFSKEIHLNFLKGPYTKRKEILVYGPHCFGSQQIEGVLLGKGVPDEAFCLIPKGDAIIFKPCPSSNIFLNGEKVSEAEVKTQDFITFKTTVIKIELKDF